MSRRRGEGVAGADRLVGLANRALEAADLSAAIDHLVAAAQLHERAGDVQGRATLLTQSSVLLRAQGRVDEAERQAGEAWEVAPDGDAGRAAASERAEVCAAKGDAGGAARWFEQAFALAGDAPAADRARLLAKQAAALANAGDHRRAADACRQAAGVLATAGDETGVSHVLLQEAAALVQAGETPAVTAALARLVERAEEAGDHALLAETHLLAFTEALLQGDTEAAMAAARAARAAALEGDSPIAYLTAAAGVAKLADAAGDRATAYESLATAWVTLADVLGSDAARRAVEPLLVDVRNRWGADTFAEVKAVHDERRRAHARRMTP